MARLTLVTMTIPSCMIQYIEGEASSMSFVLSFYHSLWIDKKNSFFKEPVRWIDEKIVLQRTCVNIARFGGTVSELSSMNGNAPNGVSR